ncbi:MAG: triose-phosphate isomerase [Proteobacteria bacterium]|jgi:triosephosphate isomerase|nr:triose-phosphate isomerase [Pseudomonadota bacterium]
MGKLIIANWKMNGSLNKIVEDFSKYMANSKTNNQKIVYALPYIFLDKMYNLFINKHAEYKLASQDISQFANTGAYTGEISGAMLKEFGVSYSIIGHSERRVMGESDVILIKKIEAAILSKITPVFCIGEPYEIRQQKQYAEFLVKQLEILKLLNNSVAEMVIAYEPIWAIGTGLTPKIDEIIEIMDLIDNFVATNLTSKVTILYGGSVSNKNAVELLSNSKIGGVLVGGASLKTEDFTAICSAI